jgi:hypothetical protein
VARNFLKGLPNPFGLAEPPDHWLTKLAAFDSQLVIFPSQKDPVYRLGRRVVKSRQAQPADVPGVENHPDTVVMCNNGLIAVTTVFPGAIWDDRVFVKLAERDLWRMGGANEAIRRMEEAEAKQAAAETKAHEDKGDAISHDAYASYKYRTGQRVSMAHKGAAKNKQAKPQHFLAPSTSPGRVILATA